MRKIKLLCLPYEGSSAMFFWGWKKELGEDITIVPLELAGRGRRIADRRYEKFEDMLEDVFKCAEHYLAEGAYAILGHSMGATLAFELVRKIEMNGKPLPEHIFLSGAKAPTTEKLPEGYSELDDEQFVQRIKEIGGIQEEISDNKELMSFVLPIIRADFKVIESYKNVKLEQKLSLKASVFYASNDQQIIDETLFPWQELFEQKVEFYKFKGNHLFINEKRSKIIGVIKSII